MIANTFSTFCLVILADLNDLFFFFLSNMAFKIMLNYLFHMDFFKHQKPMTKHLYLLYTLTTGIYYESYVCQWFRYFANIYTIIAVLFLQVCCLITLFLYETNDISVSLYCATLLISSPFVFLFILCSYYLRENLNKSLEIINEYSEYENYNKEMVLEDGNNYAIIDYNQYFKYDYALRLVPLFAFCYFIKLISVYITSEASSDINPLYDYNYPMPFLTHVNWLAYVLIYILQIAFLLPLPLADFIGILFYLLFLIIIRNRIVLLTKEIKFESYLITKSLDTFYEQETKILEIETCPINKNRKFSNISKERNLCYDKLENHTKKWIFCYQKLFTAMRLMQGYFEAILSLNLLWNTILCTCFGYISVMAPGSNNIEHFIYIMMMIPSIFACCMSGHLYESMMDELKKEIYAMPWYYLPPTHRKLILNFLTIVHRPCRVKFFKVYPITLSMYSNILMKIFSYLQIIRVMDTKM